LNNQEYIDKVNDNCKTVILIMEKDCVLELVNKPPNNNLSSQILKAAIRQKIKKGKIIDTYF